MNIVKYNRENLIEIRSLVESLNDYQYKMPLDILSNASIGQHVRHILEFYICLLRSHSTGVVSYDERERNLKIETEPSFALVVIENIVLELGELKSDIPLKLRADYSSDGGHEVIFGTSLFRELAYDLEHSIHHQALIKIGLTYLTEEQTLDENFGVAPSTVRFRSG